MNHLNKSLKADRSVSFMVGILALAAKKLMTSAFRVYTDSVQVVVAMAVSFTTKVRHFGWMLNHVFVEVNDIECNG